MTISSSARIALADEIQAMHDKYDSWQMVQDLHYPSVPRGTLCTIAKSRGAKIPKKHWRALGLTGQRRQRTEIEKRITKMAKATNDAVVRRKR
jgi:hypothetical protein